MKKALNRHTQILHVDDSWITWTWIMNYAESFFSSSRIQLKYAEEENWRRKNFRYFIVAAAFSESMDHKTLTVGLHWKKILNLRQGLPELFEVNILLMQIIHCVTLLKNVHRRRALIVFFSYRENFFIVNDNFLTFYDVYVYVQLCNNKIFPGSIARFTTNNRDYDSRNSVGCKCEILFCRP